MMDTMAKELTLSADQKTKISAIQDELAAKRKAFPKDMPREERRKQMTANRKAADTKINALLSPDQQKKYAAMQEKRRAQMAARQAGGPGGGAMGGGSGGGPKGGGMAPGSAGGPQSSAPTPGKPMASPGG
jgi:Spy/CpxP family protein refolding chaperone